MIPTINIDDRTFDDIREEAMKLIPRYCPQWTDRNLSDPGITMLSIFSWMTEMALHRINKIPTKTYLALLDMLGFSFNPPKCAKTIINFHLSPNRSRDVVVRSGVKIASVGADSEPVVFETSDNLVVRNARLAACVNRDKEKWDDIEIKGGEIVSEFSLFDSRNSVFHEIYFKSKAFDKLVAGHTVQVAFNTANAITSVTEEFINYVNWEYYDGDAWTAIQPVSVYKKHKKKDNVIYFVGPVPMEECEVNGENGLYLKATLVDLPSSSSVHSNPFNLKSIDFHILYSGDGFVPDYITMFSSGTYSSVDMNNAFKLFSTDPAYDDACYFSSDDIFSHKGVRVTFAYTLSDANQDLKENTLAQFIYECYTGEKWVRMTKERNEFDDGTKNLTKTGKVSFIIPDWMEKFKLGSQPHYWIRVRVLVENFGVGGKYEFDAEANEWKWNFKAPVQSPFLDRIRIGYDDFEQYFDRIMSYSNFEWHSFDRLCEEHASSEETMIFSVDLEHLPTLFLGFSQSVSVGFFNVYFRVDEISKNIGIDLNLIKTYFPEQEEEFNKVVIDWQMWNGTEWKSLQFTDETKCFEESGFVSFAIEEEMQRHSFFDKDLYWIRGVKVNGNFTRIPTVKSIVINAVNAENCETVYDEYIGLSDRGYSVSKKPLLGGMDVVVREDSVPSNAEIQTLVKEGINEPYYEEDGHVWVRYKEVPNFYNSNSFSRHFCVDYQNGKVMFGDGEHGLSPAKNDYRAKILKYKFGGGKVGNVGAHTLQYISSTIPYIDSCDNPFPAVGGCDVENLEEIRGRASGLLKSLERAVTPEDYEWLAREASPAVGRAFCLRHDIVVGRAKMIIIPSSDKAVGFDTKLLPSKELLKQVKSFLDERKVIGTTIEIDGPVYKRFSIELSIEFQNIYFDLEEEENKISGILKEFFHPLYGSENGLGWKTGEPINATVIQNRLDSVESIKKILSIEIFDIEQDIPVDEFTLTEEQQLPFLEKVKIVSRTF